MSWVWGVSCWDVGGVDVGGGVDVVMGLGFDGAPYPDKAPRARSLISPRK